MGTAAQLNPASDAGPATVEEQVACVVIALTFVLYAFGMLYIVGPVLGWVLAWRVIQRTGLRAMHAVLWLWIGGMVLMALALLVGHLQADLGMGALVKSSVGWAKGWALLALFMVVGWSGVRLRLMARASCVLGIQCLAVLALATLAMLAGLPGHLFVSPLSVVGGSGPEYFAVDLYSISPDTGQRRFALFAPWAPAIGMVMTLHFFVALNEPDRRWRLLGLAGCLAAVLASGSRLGLLALPVVWVGRELLKHLGQPRLYLLAAPVVLVVTLMLGPLMQLVEQAQSAFHGARADSSRVRAALGRIALQRWSEEAPWWGHGTVERGPHLVEFMPIGSHHSWLGLLFVKGVAGVVALALPMVVTLVVLVRHARHSAALNTALALLLTLVLYSFAENLEILSYLYWPALVVIGSALASLPPRKPIRNGLTQGLSPAAPTPQA